MTKETNRETLYPRGHKDHPDNKKKATTTEKSKKPTEVKADGNTNTND